MYIHLFTHIYLDIKYMYIYMCTYRNIQVNQSYKNEPYLYMYIYKFHGVY